VLVARQHGLAVEPADLESVTAAEAPQVLDREREAPLADVVGGALEVGEVVARDLLMRADQEVRKLPPARAGLGEELRDRRLQQRLREEERGLERHPAAAAAARAREHARVRVLIEEPLGAALEDRREQLEQSG